MNEEMYNTISRRAAKRGYGEEKRKLCDQLTAYSIAVGVLRGNKPTADNTRQINALDAEIDAIIARLGQITVSPFD